MVAFPQAPQTLGQLFGGRFPQQQQQPMLSPQMSAAPLPADPVAELQAQRPQQPQFKDWQKIVGALGDALQTFGGGRATFAPYAAGLQEAERERLQREHEAGMKRAGDRQDFIFEEQWKRDNPMPVNNDTVQDYNFWQSKLSPDDFQQYVQHKVNPPLYRQGPDGQFYPVAPPPSKPVGKLTPIPGGTSGNTGGGFR